MAWYFSKKGIWISPKNSILIITLAFSLIKNEINCEVTVFKGDPALPKSVDMDEIRKLLFVNRPRQPRQDDGDDGGDDGDGDGAAAGGAANAGGIGGAFMQLFGNGNTLNTLVQATGALPQLFQALTQVSAAVNMGLNGTDTPNIPSFFFKQGAQAANLIQQIQQNGQMGQGAQSITSIIANNVGPIGGLIPGHGPPPGAVNGAQRPGGLRPGIQRPGGPLQGVSPELQMKLLQIAMQNQQNGGGGIPQRPNGQVQGGQWAGPGGGVGGAAGVGPGFTLEGETAILPPSPIRQHPYPGVWPGTQGTGQGPASLQGIDPQLQQQLIQLALEMHQQEQKQQQHVQQQQDAQRQQVQQQQDAQRQQVQQPQDAQRIQVQQQQDAQRQQVQQQDTQRQQALQFQQQQQTQQLQQQLQQLQHQQAQLQQQQTQLQTKPEEVGPILPPEDYSAEEIQQRPFPTQAPQNAPTVPNTATSAPASASAPQSSSDPQLTKELAQLASKLPDQAQPVDDSETQPNLWELYSMLQNLPQNSPQSLSSDISSTSETPVNLMLLKQAMYAKPEQFSNALLQSMNIMIENMRNQLQQQQNSNPHPSFNHPTTSEPFFNLNNSPTQNPTWVFANRPYSPSFNNPTSISSVPYSQRPTYPPHRRLSTTPSTTTVRAIEILPTESPHIYHGSLLASKAPVIPPRPPKPHTTFLVNQKAPEFIKSPISSHLTLPISGYVPSVVSVFEGVDSQKPVGPQPNDQDASNGFGHKAPYSPIIKGVLIETPRLRPSNYDYAKRPPSGLVINTEEKSTTENYAFQVNNINSIIRQQQQQYINNNNRNTNYGAVHTTTTTTTTRRPPPPSTPTPPRKQGGAISPGNASWIAAVKDIQSRPVTTRKPARNRTRGPSKRPSLISGPIYWMNMFYPKGTTTQKSSVYKFKFGE